MIKMITRFLAVFITFVVLFFTTPGILVFAQEGASESQSWQCLSAEQTGGHSVNLSLAEDNNIFPPGTDVYIVECLSSDQGAVCTTGEEDADIVLFGGTQNLQLLQDKYNYRRVKFSGEQPMQTDLNGKIEEVSWESSTMPPTSHTFFGVHFLIPPEENSGGGTSLKLSSFYPQRYTDESCVSSLRWDPYGRVFDSRSLEPLPNVLVTLYTREGGVREKVVLPGVTNPVLTGDNGMFNFVVPDGVYILDPSVSTHIFPNTPAVLHPNYTQAYWDIYRGGDIRQRGSIEHRDIPVDSLNSPYRAPAKILDYAVMLKKRAGKYQVSGAVSHPLSTVQIFTGEKLIGELRTSKFGNFEVSLNASEIDLESGIELQIVKADLTQAQTRVKGERNWIFSWLRKLVHKVSAQTESSTVLIEPIVNNLAGFAYDSQGNVLPDATVAVLLDFSDRVYYETQADSRGFFRIGSEYLPSLPFHLQFSSADGNDEYIVSTSKFTRLNKSFLAKEKLDLREYKPSVEETKPSEEAIKSPGVVRESVAPTGPGGGIKGGTETPVRKNALVIVVFVVVILAGVWIGSIFYLRRKASQENAVSQDTKK